ncbi:hypothetical protein MVES_001162 [Malassezia vespertilionis]|uniref:Erv46p n=2 Tax=Malassezia vespertilionis TaxID=2020962 RepID=A0A2N1JFF6_9BASI|nr:hypothetical protein MVES_001162 [Malassezia vespertilionis]
MFGVLRGLDAFGRTSEDVRIRTNVGALITLGSALLIFVLSLSEFIDYRRITTMPQFEIDRSSQDMMSLYMNISFPHMPCYLISVDVVDILGHSQTNMDHTLQRKRLQADGTPIEESTEHHLESEAQRYIGSLKRGSNYCGSCYGAMGPESGCCQTCEDVREAYARSSWSFDSPDDIQQCVDEHWTESVREMNDEGCNLSGELHISRVVGNLHINLGRSFQHNDMNVNELVPYLQGQGEGYHHFGHEIHDFSFGTPYEFLPQRGGRTERALYRKKRMDIRDPLAGRKRHLKESQFMYQYFLKVIPTSIRHINGKHLTTYVYSVAHNERDLRPEDTSLQHETDNKSDGVITRNMQGVPGLFFNYDIAPLTLVQTETRHSFWHFISNLFAIIGGIFTIAGLLDALIYRGRKQLSGTQYAEDMNDNFYSSLDAKLL